MVSVIIVTTNNLKYLKDCIRSLQNQSFKDFETIIVFNNSQENIIENVKRKFSEANFIINNENLLFSKAYNQGIKLSKGKYVLCLNDDVVLKNNFIEELMNSIQRDKQIGMISGKILRMDKITIDSTGLFLGKSRKPVERGFGQQDDGRYNKEGYIFGVNGAAVLYRKAMLEDIKNEDGYFDSTYGLFYEDLDLSWRANRFGWKAFYNPKAIAYHIRGGTTKSQSPKNKLLGRYYVTCLSNDLQFHLLKNRYMTIVKNDSLKDFVLCLGNILLYELKLWGYILLFRPQIILKTPQIIKYIRIALKKRKAIRIRLGMFDTNISIAKA